MKRYGLTIGKVGVEFASQQDREKALVLFTKGSTVSISDYAGQRYQEGENCFGCYERETNEVIMNCDVCKAQVSNESCSSRTVPRRDYQGKFSDDLERTESRIICDVCYANLQADFEKHKAKKILENA